MGERTPLAHGRDADVYDLGDGRVLRRYRDGAEVAREAEVMRFVAGHGVPVPLVSAASGCDLVMERLSGPTLLGALEAGQVGAAEAAQVLADLHARLDAVPPRPGRPGQEQVLHLDLHPDNVMLEARGPVLIDWRNTTDGHRAVDVAMTALILAQVAVDGTDSRATTAADVLASFVRRVGSETLTVLDDVAARRARDRNLTGSERDLLPEAVSAVRRVAGDHPGP
jgi:tRNA A-37 threonylcarbamoyl transferase component Bud32